MKTINYFRSVILISAVITLPPLSFAGSSNGNGGHAVTCFRTTEAKNKVLRTIEYNDEQVSVHSMRDPLAGAQDQITSVELFDLFEGKSPDLFEDDSQPIETRAKLHTVLKERLEIMERTTTFYDTISAAQKAVMSNLTASPGGVMQVYDTGHQTIIPGNCLLIQAAIQKRDIVTDKVKVSINQTLLSRMTEVHKAALLLHEMLYLIAIENLERDSHNTRALVRLVMSKKFEKMSPDEVSNAFNQSGITRHRSSNAYPVISIAIGGVNVRAAIDSNFNRRTLTGSLSSRDAVRLTHNGQIYEIPANASIELKNGAIRSMHIASPVNVGDLRVRYLVSFHDSGKLASGYLSGDQNVNGLPLIDGTLVNLNENGALVNSLLLGNAKPVEWRGILLPAYSALHFDDEGNLRKIETDGTLRTGDISCKRGIVQLHTNGLIASCELEIPLTRGDLTFIGETKFHQNGALASSTLTGACRNSVESEARGWSGSIRECYTKIQDFDVVHESSIEFYESGSLKKFTPAYSQEIDSTLCQGKVYGRGFLGGWKFWVSGKSHGTRLPISELSPSGKLLSCDVDQT